MLMIDAAERRTLLISEFLCSWRSVGSARPVAEQVRALFSAPTPV